jgi:hypothetical protein
VPRTLTVVALAGPREVVLDAVVMTGEVVCGADCVSEVRAMEGDRAEEGAVGECEDDDVMTIPVVVVLTAVVVVVGAAVELARREQLPEIIRSENMIVVKYPVTAYEIFRPQA